MKSLHLEKYSIGIGDRFGLEGAAQLRALQDAQRIGADVVPVWNKSNREHSIIGTTPDDTRREADDAVRTCGWKGSYYVDADHIGLATVDRFLQASNFFTIDVADYIGKPTDPASEAGFIRSMGRFKGELSIPGVDRSITVTDATLRDVASKYLGAVKEAGKVYRAIEKNKGAGTFVPEISVDEANASQTPAEMFFILAAIAHEGIPIQTIAPKFTGSFLKGIDYVGNVRQFQTEFEEDLAVVAHAVKTFGLPPNLKLSVHSGSDKFSLYPIIHNALLKFDAGLHLKTAGTTWLEEVIGLAASGGNGLAMAKEIYVKAFPRFDELAQPYLTVIEIDRKKLPSPSEIEGWSPQHFVDVLRHDSGCAQFDLHFRQFVHIAFRIAAELGDRYSGLLRECRSVIEQNVHDNLLQRHIRPLFLGEAGTRSQTPPRNGGAKIDAHA